MDIIFLAFTQVVRLSSSPTAVLDLEVQECAWGTLLVEGRFGLGLQPRPAIVTILLSWGGLVEGYGLSLFEWRRREQAAPRLPGVYSLILSSQSGSPCSQP